MKTLISALFLLIGLQTFAQEDSVQVTSDTSEIYVINTTNRLIQIDGEYAFEFRDLKSLKSEHFIYFGSVKDMQKFFDTCFRVLEKDVTIVGDNYTVNRNKLSKNVVRVHGKDEDYFMLSYETVDKMQTAFHRQTNP